MNGEEQAKNVSAKTAERSWVISQLRHSLENHTLESVNYSLVYSHIYYCVTSWGCASKTCKTYSKMSNKMNHL